MMQPPRRDVLVGVAVAVLGAVEALSVDQLPARPVALTMAVLGGLTLAWRRAAPLFPATVVAVGPLGGLTILGGSWTGSCSPWS
jgi:hypothetical protein